MHGVGERAARADLLQPAPALRQDPAAGHEVELVQGQLAVAGAGGLDARELIVEIRQIGERPVGRELEAGDHVRSIWHRSSSAWRAGRTPGQEPSVTVLGRVLPRRLYFCTRGPLCLMRDQDGRTS